MDLLIAKQLHNSLMGLDSGPFEWAMDCQVAFDTLEEKLVLASALGSPNVQKPFLLYGSEVRQAGPTPTDRFSHGESGLHCT